MLEYQNAGFDQRLNMYLEFPELRESFLDIDQKDSVREILSNTHNAVKLINISASVQKFLCSIIYKIKIKNHY
jgi:hypothetical protein